MSAEKDYILIEDGRYRVEVNMNTVEEWESLSGLKLGQFEVEAAESAKTGGIATRPMLLWLFCAIREGESIDGREFAPDFKSFKRMLRPSVMTQFAPIFLKHYMGNVTSEKEQPDEVKKKEAKSNSVRFDKWRLALFVGLPVALAALAVWWFSMR